MMVEDTLINQKKTFTLEGNYKKALKSRSAYDKEQNS